MTAAAIHPYLTAMSFPLAVAVFARFWLTKLMTWQRAAIATFVTAAGMVAVWFIVGYISVADVEASGFGEFSADVLTFFDPQLYSRLLPPFYLAASHWEGFGFLGIGGIVLAAIAIVVLVRERPTLPRAARATVVVCGLLAVYALSSDIRIDDVLVLRIRRLYSYIKPVTETFRASGRFIWPLHYLVLLGGIWGAVRVVNRRHWPATVLLIAAIVAQAADLRLDPKWAADKPFRRPEPALFNLARGHFRHMALFPMEISGACGATYDEEYIYRYMLEAYRQNLTYNSGVFARFSQGAAEAECRRSGNEIDAGVIDPQTVYVVDRDYVTRFSRAGGICGRFDGDWICVAQDSDERFRKLVAGEK
jgi:hypothetical protein